MDAKASNRRLRVAFVTPKYPPNPSGFGNQAHSVNSILSERVHMFLLTCGRRAETLEAVHDTIKDIPHKPEEYSAGQLALWIIETALWLIRHRKKYDIIHVLSGYYWSIPFVLVGRLLRKPTVVKITSREIEPTVGKGIGRRLRILFLRLASCLVVLTEHTSSAAQKAGFKSKQIRRIPNGVQVSRYAISEGERSRLRKELGITEDCFVLLFVGQIGRRKGIDRLLLAWNKFYRTSASSLLMLVGAPDGSVSQQKLQTEGVCLPGHVKDPSKYFAVADCFILLSRSEGMPNVILEAVAAGTPFIVSDIPPNRELARYFGGIVVSGDDEGMAMDAAMHLATLAPASNQSKIEDARALLREEFSLESVARQYEQLYIELVSGRRP